MCRRSNPIAHDSGAILLHTLLLLMVVAGLVLSVVSTAVRNTLDTDAFQRRTELENQLESAVEVIVLGILARNGRPIWPQPSEGPKRIVVNGIPMHVTVKDVRGLLDLNAADRVFLEKLVSVLFPVSTGHKMLDRLDSIRTGRRVIWGGYSDVGKDLGLSVQQIRCLQSYVTLFSGLSRPDWRYAAIDVISVLDLPVNRENQSALSEENAAVGHTYKVVLSAALEGLSTADLVIEILVTGNSRTPYTIRSWAWMPREESTQCVNG